MQPDAPDLLRSLDPDDGDVPAVVILDDLNAVRATPEPAPLLAAWARSGGRTLVIVACPESAAQPGGWTPPSDVEFPQDLASVADVRLTLDLHCVEPRENSVATALCDVLVEGADTAGRIRVRFGPGLLCSSVE